ncbi:cysteine-rich repeat secretory protein 1-like [Bidens hawaiensis]|uniref:cysteine-rich repeat secretory protein 1-like n=1 Tax=Bidens hawaiensis TaxID=980011 RepID=UPI00404A028A
MYAEVVISKAPPFKKNRDSALDKLFTLLNNSSSYVFQHTEVGDKPDEKISASYFCTPTSKGICECCLRNVVKYLKKNCPKQNEVVAWDFYPYHTCMVRYSASRKTLSVLDDWAWYDSPHPTFVKAVDLEKTMDSLTSKLKVQAAGGGDALKRFATGTTNYDGEEHALYVVVQCTPDISKEDCIKCLSKASIEVRSCCTKKLRFGGMATSTNCYAWYHHISFFGDVPTKFDKEVCR